MTATTVLGQGPDVVLLHGVGVGPDSFSETARLLAGDRRVLVPARPGGDGGAVPLEEQADAVAAEMVAHGAAGARIVGTSGGATLALVLALRRPDLVGSLLLHEPLVGRHAPGLQRRFRSAADAAAAGDAAALEVVRGVLGAPTWDRLGEAGRAGVAALARRARHEVPVFAAFDPPAEELAGLRALPVLVTVGGSSGAERHEAARALVELAGAESAVLDGAGNAAQLDAPAALAELVLGWEPAPARSGA